MTLTLSFTENLHSWYKKHARQLPWRKTSDPYKIWVSETILQQTRVAQGLPYYLSFTERFPDVKALATAQNDEIMKYWEGLGYYTRIRNMHEAAKTIVSELGGKFPSDYETIRKLKGIGDYTAAAIASIAFGLPYAAVDGNVTRVVARLFGVEEAVNTAAAKKTINRIAGELLDTANPGKHNQAMMELGALVCKPQNPDCSICPAKNGCYAYINNIVSKLPVKNEAKPKKVRYFIFMVIQCDDTFAVEKRKEQDIWKNLYQFPLIETETVLSDEEIISLPEIQNILNSKGGTLAGIGRLREQKLTHRQIKARFVYIKTDEKPTFTTNIIWINPEDFSTFAFPVLIKNYWKENKFHEMYSQ